MALWSGEATGASCENMPDEKSEQVEMGRYLYCIVLAISTLTICENTSSCREAAKEGDLSEEGSDDGKKKIGNGTNRNANGLAWPMTEVRHPDYIEVGEFCSASLENVKGKKRSKSTLQESLRNPLEALCEAKRLMNAGKISDAMEKRLDSAKMCKQVVKELGKIEQGNRDKIALFCGYLYLENGSGDDALDAFELIIGSADWAIRVESRIGIGEVYFRASEWERAIEKYLEAQGEVRKVVDGVFTVEEMINNRLAWSYYRMHRCKEAMEMTRTLRGSPVMDGQRIDSVSYRTDMGSIYVNCRRELKRSGTGR
jgi:tetratricopeptide (TPR) repeat protein